MRATFLFITLVGLASAQAPTGTITGVVHDPSGSVVRGALVKVASLATGLERSGGTSEQGDYSFPALLAGEYEVAIEALGFHRSVRRAVVEAGATTKADFSLRVGELSETVTVDGASPQMHYDTHSVGGTITRAEIDNLPLNGRSFLELAKLEPGVQPPGRGSFNRTFLSVLGGMGSNNIGAKTRVTVDGGSIMQVGNGGSAMGSSQEAVQEFQISTVNFDLSTGIGDVGAVNVVSRSGGNSMHGSAFYFFRDHKLAAYPALNRDAANPDPFFQRRQFGFAVGGPIRRDRAFYFANWERNEQRGVVSTTLLVPEFSRFSRTTPSPLFGNQLTLRLDGRLSEMHTAFVRYSHDGNRAFSPTTVFGPGPAAYPSQWTRQKAWADQAVLGATSVLGTALVNDFRFSYFFNSSTELAPREEECPGCLGIGAPTINVQLAGLFIGNSTPSYNLGRRLHWNDSLAWRHANHRVRFGVEWEHSRGGLLQWNHEPATLNLFSPQEARQNGIPIPASFTTLDDILRLPLGNPVSIGIGDPRVTQQGGGNVRTWNNARLYFQDAWQIHEGLTVNYGLGWTVDHSLNYDLRKPPLLAPLLGPDGLGPTRKEWKNFSPVLGWSWSPWRDGRTVLRAGAGVYYDFFLQMQSGDAERALFGPPTVGRHVYTGGGLRNTLPDIPGVPVGASLNFLTPTRFSGSDLLLILPALRAGLLQDLRNADPSVPSFQLDKAGGMVPARLPNASGLHSSFGIQREILRGFVLSADFAYRHFIHLPLAADLNHFNALAPAIPKCVGAQRSDPGAFCSNGSINVQEAAAVAAYKGLLVRADKRFSRGFQFLASWAYSSNTGTNVGLNYYGFELDNWLQNRGPLNTDYTNILNLAGVARLPWGVEIGLNFSYSSVPPFAAWVGGIDFNGDGTKSDLLPGTTANVFNRGMDRADLERLVTRFNATYAGTKDGLRMTTIPPLKLPEHYSLGDNFHSLDLRLNRSFLFHDRWRLSLIGEVFNLYNKANLSGYSGDVTSSAFGQPTSRATQIFGSGGPRAFQVALRLGF